MRASSLILLAALPLSAHAAQPGRAWVELAEQDLRAMHAQIRENHPGAFDDRNPDFKVWLERGFREGLVQAKAARTPGAYLAAIRRYAAGFRDGHLGIDVNLTPARIAWPGFTVGLRGDRYQVVALDPKAARDDPSLPPLGAGVKACDGLTPKQWVERDALPYQPGPMLERTWVAATPTILQDRGYPGFQRAAKCTFEIGEAERELTLRYRNIGPETLAQLVVASGYGAPPEMGVRTAGERGAIWVSLPTFHAADDPAVLQKLKAIIAEAPAWREAPMVVFDVRGNTGGSSAFGSELLQSLYGADFYRWASAKQDDGPAQYVDWRASKDNAAYMQELVRLVTTYSGADSKTAAYFRTAEEGVRKASQKGQTFWRRAEDEEDTTPVNPAEPPPNPVRARVYLLTDGRCASACLDFADELLRAMPGVVHAGLTTSADSVYMEVRPAGLPSGAATLHLAIKVYRNRPRGHNEPYVPRHRFPGYTGDTAAVEKWLLQLDAQR